MKLRPDQNVILAQSVGHPKKSWPETFQPASFTSQR